jgi:5-methylcytosine-specific restriction protein A
MGRVGGAAMAKETGKRAFRSPESYAAERVSRDAVKPFLELHGYRDAVDVRRKVGEGDSQLVTALTPDGEAVRMRVRLCWRREGRRPTERLYAAAQLRARTIDNNWELTLDSLIAGELRDGITHTLIFQRDGMEVVYAALIPRDAIKPIWLRQRDISAKVIASGTMGRKQKNHAMNGQSPTIYLQDDRYDGAHAVADALWAWDGVVDIARQPVVERNIATDDTFDDCPGLDDAQIGSDGARRVRTVRSGVRRDAAVRAKVIARAKNACERASCHTTRGYSSFLDVHHILGAEASDRVWTCVALCPNCHREAHVAPDADSINLELLAYATTFAPDELSQHDAVLTQDASR